MPGPRENTQAVADALAAVKAHCMCARFEDDGARYLVYLPPGYRVDAVGVAKEMQPGGKARALAILLEKLQFYWLVDLPASMHPEAPV